MQLSTITDNLDRFAEGFLGTVKLTALGGLGALLLGSLLAGMRVSPIASLRAGGLLYVETFRNCPLPVLVILMTFGLPKLGDPFRGTSFFIYGLSAIVIYHASFVCEALRSGINSVGAGQGEAARSLGLGFGQVLRLVVLPQAFRTVIPPLGNVLIALTKNTAVVALIDVVDITRVTETIINDTVDPIMAVLGSAMAYLILTLPMGLLVGRIERRSAFAR